MKVIKNIPKQWKLTNLRNLLTKDIQNGYSPNCPEEPNGKWILGLGNLTENGFDPTQAKPAPIDDEKVNDFLLEPGDFLISRSNTLDKVGRVILFRGELEKCSYPDLLMRFHVDEGIVSSEYLENYFRSSQVRKYIQGCASGTSNSMVKITKQIVDKIPVVLPFYSEQKSIADMLFTWDEAIEKTERLIAAKAKRFKWLMNELINKGATASDARKRGWEKIELGEVGNITQKVKLITVKGEVLLRVKLHCLGIKKNDRIIPTLSEKGRPYYKRFAGEFLIGRQNFHNGGFGIIPDTLDGLIASNAITTLELNEKKIDSWFLWYQFANPNYYKRIGHIMDGTGQKELSDKQILKLTIYFLPIEKQKQIAETLNNAQSEINLLKQLAKKHKEQKRGLMQKLLTGAWRVRVGNKCLNH